MKVKLKNISKKNINKTSILINKKSIGYKETDFLNVINIFLTEGRKRKGYLFNMDDSKVNYKYYTFMDVKSTHELILRLRAVLNFHILKGLSIEILKENFVLPYTNNKNINKI
jgi:hypothetical protein